MQLGSPSSRRGDMARFEKKPRADGRARWVTLLVPFVIFAIYVCSVGEFKGARRDGFLGGLLDAGVAADAVNAARQAPVDAVAAVQVATDPQNVVGKQVVDAKPEVAAVADNVDVVKQVAEAPKEEDAKVEGAAAEVAGASEDVVAAAPAPAPVPASGFGPGKIPECAKDGKRAKSFLMVFMGHSGSSAILSELFSHSQTHQKDPEPVDHYEYQHNTTLALKYTRDFFDEGISLGKTPGFKIRPRHIKEDPEAWAQLAREYDTRIIWQYRMNLFKSSIGEYSHRKLNDTSVVEGLRGNMTAEERCKVGAGCSFRVEDHKYFHTLLKDSVLGDKAISTAVHLISGGGSCVYALPYENYLYDRETSMRELQTFLGLTFEDNPPLRRKATSDNMCSVVTNWNEMCSNFYGCHVWRSMMDDPRNGCKCEDFSSGHVEFCAVE